MGSLQAAFRKRLAKAGTGTVGDVLSSKKPGSKTQQIWDSAKRSSGRPPVKKTKPGKYPAGRYGSITVSPNPRKPKQTTFGGSVGDVEREHEHTYGSLPAAKAAVRKAVQAVHKDFPPTASRKEDVKTIGGAWRDKPRGPRRAESGMRIETKHRDKQGSTAHHKHGGGRQSRPKLSVPDTHLLRIARQNAEMNPAMQGVMGGPDIEESKKIIERLTGRPYKQPKVSPWTGKPYNPRGRDWQQRQQKEEADVEQRHPKGRKARERLQEEHGPVRNPWR